MIRTRTQLIDYLASLGFKNGRRALRVTAARSPLVMILFVASATPPAVAAADTLHQIPAATKNDQLFKALCIGEKSTGFNWVNNEWTYVQFNPHKYLIEKLKPEPTQRALFCWNEAKDKTRYETADYAIDWGCYSVHESGTSPSVGSLCIEEWRKVSGSFTLRTVSCEHEDQFHFEPDGNFIAADARGGDAALAAKSNYKDSLSVTVGRCSIVP